MQGSKPPPREGITNNNTPEGTPSYERSFKSDTSPSTSCSQAGQTSDEPTCTARSGGGGGAGGVRRLGSRILSTDSQYEDLNGHHPQPSTGTAGLLQHARDPSSRLARASLVLPEQTMSLHLNNLNDPPAPATSAAAEPDADVVCTVSAVKNEWETTRFSDKSHMIHFASEKHGNTHAPSLPFLLHHHTSAKKG